MRVDIIEVQSVKIPLCTFHPSVQYFSLHNIKMYLAFHKNDSNIFLCTLHRPIDLLFFAKNERPNVAKKKRPSVVENNRDSRACLDISIAVRRGIVLSL